MGPFRWQPWHQWKDRLWDNYRHSASFVEQTACWPVMRIHVNVSVNQGCGLGLESYKRLVSVSSRSRLEISTSHLGWWSQRLGLISFSGGECLGLVSVSSFYVSCPSPLWTGFVPGEQCTCETCIHAWHRLISGRCDNRKSPTARLVSPNWYEPSYGVTGSNC